MGLIIKSGDIFNQKVSAMVAPSQPSLKLEGPIGSELEKRCGKKLSLDLKQLMGPPISQCVLTNAYNLNCEKIIFVSTPKYEKGNQNFDYLLKQSYKHCLQKALDYGVSSIAFPLLSSGANGCPDERAIKIALTTIKKFTEQHDIDVMLVFYNHEKIIKFGALLKGFDIRKGDEACLYERKNLDLMISERRRQLIWYSKKLDESTGKTFGEKLVHYAAVKQIKYADCFTGVITKQQFYKYLNDISKPNKNTVISLGINMKLNLYEITDLLKSIEETFSPDQLDSDSIILEYLEEVPPKDWNVFDLNEKLEDAGCYPLKTT